MRRSCSVLVVSMTVFLVMAMAAFGICGPPVSGEGSESWRQLQDPRVQWGRLAVRPVARRVRQAA